MEYENYTAEEATEQDENIEDIANYYKDIDDQRNIDY